MRRIVALGAFIVALVMLTGSLALAGASQPAPDGVTVQTAKPQNLATLMPVRPPSFSVKPTVAACRNGGQPCSADSQCCSQNCHGPVQGWAGWKRYCSADD